MIKVIFIVGLLIVSSASSATSQFAGTWTGQYRVDHWFSGGESVTSVTLKIVEVAPSKFQATFYFYPTPTAENVGEVSGCFAMTGSVNQKTKKISLGSSGWLGGKSRATMTYIKKTFADPSSATIESISASISGESLSGTGGSSKYDKVAPSFVFKRADERKTQLPTRCEVGTPLPKITPPNQATIGFMNAMANGNYDVMEIYLQKGADINCRNCSDDSREMVFESQTTPLIRAIGGGWGSIKMVKWLVEHGADVNQPDAYGRTPVMHAASRTQGALQINLFSPGVARGDEQMLQYLLSAGGKLGVRDMNLGNSIGMLMPVTSVGNSNIGFEKTIRILTDKGEDINLPNQFGDTLLTQAARNCADASISTILNLGAEPNVKNALGQTPLDIALEKAQGNHPPCNLALKILMNKSTAAVSDSKSGSMAPVTSASSSAGQQDSPVGVESFAGTYGGTYTGQDSGEFGATVSPTGSATFWMKPYKIQNRFAGSGKVDANGSAVFSTTGAPTFTGTITPKGTIEGTWTIEVRGQRLSGNFTGNRTVVAQNEAVPANPVGALLNILKAIPR